MIKKLDMTEFVESSGNIYDLQENSNIQSKNNSEKDNFLSHIYAKLVRLTTCMLSGDVVFRKVFDMMLVYYTDEENPDYFTDRMPPFRFVSKKVLKKFQITEEEMYHAALNNMSNNWDISLTIKGALESSVVFTLTNKENKNGASVMLIPGLLKKIARSLNDDLFIVPFTNHEVMIHLASEVNVRSIIENLDAFSTSLVLSKNILYYKKESDNIISLREDWNS